MTDLWCLQDAVSAAVRGSDGAERNLGHGAGRDSTPLDSGGSGHQDSPRQPLRLLRGHDGTLHAAGTTFILMGKKVITEIRFFLDRFIIMLTKKAFF